MKVLFLILCLILGFTASLHAQDLPAVPAEYLSKPLKEWQLDVTTGTIALFVLGRAYKSIRQGGGLVGLVRGLLYGENVPNAVAKDYCAEIKPPKADKPQ